jgi:UDP:flavonoid glycosyltransferase YjiC (YdhE family)
MKYLFIYTIFPGHLYRTYPLAKRLIAEGHEVHYLLMAKNESSFTLPSGAEYETLGLPPMYHAFHKYPNDKSEGMVREEITRTGSALMAMVNAHQPDQILLDEFCSIELLYLIPAGWGPKITVLSTFFPSFPNPFFPPQDMFALPGSDMMLLWERMEVTKKKNLEVRQNLILDVFEKQKLPNPYRVWNFNQLHPAVTQIRKVYLHNREFDFGGQPLKEWEKYGGPMVDIGREEMVAPFLEKLLVNFLSKDQSNKIVSISFGTIARDLLEEEKLITFFRSLNALSKSFDQVLFVAKVPKTLTDKIRKTSVNLIYVCEFPQLFLLSHSSAFITHGGGSSMYEALMFGVPLLVIPPSNLFDYPGNGARTVYQNVGLYLESNPSLEEIKDALDKLLRNDVFTEKAVAWSKLLRETDNFY